MNEGFNSTNKNRPINVQQEYRPLKKTASKAAKIPQFHRLVIGIRDNLSITELHTSNAIFVTMIYINAGGNRHSITKAGANRIIKLRK